MVISQEREVIFKFCFNILKAKRIFFHLKNLQFFVKMNSWKNSKIRETQENPGEKNLFSHFSGKPFKTQFKIKLTGI